MSRSTPWPDATTLVSEVLSRGPDASAVFVRRGMACPGCAMAQFMTLAEAAAAYRIRTETLLADLQRTLAGLPG